MRNCGGCTLCCRLIGVEELFKPPGQWCRHCHIGHGCRIYADRPQACRQFRCLWLEDPSLPDDLRPDRSGVVLRRQRIIYPQLMATAIEPPQPIYAILDGVAPGWEKIRRLLVNDDVRVIRPLQSGR